MTIQQETYEKIMRLPENDIKLILVIVDEIARQHGIIMDTEPLLTNKKKAFEKMLELREQSIYPKDFNYKKVLEDALDEKLSLIHISEPTRQYS